MLAASDCPHSHNRNARSETDHATRPGKTQPWNSHISLNVTLQGTEGCCRQVTIFIDASTPQEANDIGQRLGMCHLHQPIPIKTGKRISRYGSDEKRGKKMRKPNNLDGASTRTPPTRWLHIYSKRPQILLALFTWLLGKTFRYRVIDRNNET